MTKRVPEIRFEGFNNGWEQCKLEKLGKIQTGNTPSTKDISNYSENGVLWVTPTDIKSLVITDTAKKLSKTGIKKARIAKAGSILVTSIASIGKNTLILEDSGFNQQINSLTPSTENDSYFLLTQSELWSKKMKHNASSGTMQIVNKSEFSNIEMLIPTLEEQKKIGVFFKYLDDTIALHQCELEQLQSIKEGFLEKLFPKDRENEPEIRFLGFADDWEQRKFKDFTKISQGLQIAISKRFLNEGENRLFYITNEFLNPNSSVKYYIENAPESMIANSEDILMTRTGNTGKVVTNVHGAFHNNFFKIAYDKSKTNKLFLFFLLNSNYIQNEIRIGAGSSTIPDLKHPNFYKINVNITSLEEQTKIGNFFKSLDDTITLHQRELELLKQSKKAFLQKMFV